MRKTLVNLLITTTFAFGAPFVLAAGKGEQKLKKKNVVRSFESQARKSEKRFSSWGVDPKEKMSINVSGVWKKFKKKKDIVVAVVDTGIDPGHPFLKNNLMTLKGKTGPQNFGVDFSRFPKSKTAPHDSHGHGTHIAGIIKSVFPQVKILTLKYYNPKVKNKYNLEATIKALEYAVDSNVDIINYSSGGAGASYEELRVLKKAEAKGILVVAAAGNESSNIDKKDNYYFPASYKLKNIITVINHNKDGRLSASSNFGKITADISAPGSRIKSSYPAGRAGYLTGTSQSTAFVTGVAALLMSQYTHLSTQEIKRVILSSAKKNKDFIKLCKSGGILDATNAYLQAGKLNTKVAKTKRKNSERFSRKLATKHYSR